MAGRGDRDDDFTAWAAARRGSLLRGAFLMCGDWAGAEDLVQEALVKVYLAWRREVRNPDAYARKVLLNAFLDQRRRPSRREQPTDRLPEPVITEGLPFDEVDALRTALAGLAPRQRAAVVLRHWFGMSVDETARELGCSAGTVKSQTFDAVQRLRVALGGSAEAPVGGEGSDGADDVDGADIAQDQAHVTDDGPPAPGRLARVRSLAQGVVARS